MMGHAAAHQNIVIVEFDWRKRGVGILVNSTGVMDEPSDALPRPRFPTGDALQSRLRRELNRANQEEESFSRAWCLLGLSDCTGYDEDRNAGGLSCQSPSHLNRSPIGLLLWKQPCTRSRQKKDWRRSLGIAGDSELMRQIDEEGRKIREADREAARRGEEDT